MNIEFCNEVKISYPASCGNAPKKVTLVNLYKAFANNDKKFLIENTSDKLVWNIIGKKKITGRDEVVSLFYLYSQKGIKEIQIINVITHGNVAAVNGRLVFNDESSFAFCDVYNFSGFGKNAKIREVNSYLIKIS